MQQQHQRQARHKLVTAEIKNRKKKSGKTTVQLLLFLDDTKQLGKNIFALSLEQLYEVFPFTSRDNTSF